MNRAPDAPGRRTRPCRPSRSPRPRRAPYSPARSTLQATASDDVGVAGVQFFVDGTPQGPEDTVAPYAANWDTRASPNGAHTVAARARDTDNKTTNSTPVNVTVANTDNFQNEVLATGFNLPTAMKFLPDGRLLLTEVGGKILVLRPPYTAPDPTPFLQIANIHVRGSSSRASSTWSSTPTSRATTTSTSSTPRPSRAPTAYRASRRTRPSRARFPAASLSSTRTRRSPSLSTTAAPSPSETTG